MGSLILTLYPGRRILIDGPIALSLPLGNPKRVRLQFEGPGDVLREELDNESEKEKARFAEKYEPPPFLDEE